MVTAYYFATRELRLSKGPYKGGPIVSIIFLSMYLFYILCARRSIARNRTFIIYILCVPIVGYYWRSHNDNSIELFPSHREDTSVYDINYHMLFTFALTNGVTSYILGLDYIYGLMVSIEVGIYSLWLLIVLCSRNVIERETTVEVNEISIVM
jgi:hypothetical protein